MIALWKKRGVSALLFPFSRIYGGVVAVRNRKYDRHRDRTARLPARVISVGNITVGGTGKTPLVIFLAERLQKRGHGVAVLSRGYGRMTRHVHAVPDGRDAPADPAESGDEPALMARRLDGIPVVVGKDRVSASRMCIQRYGSDMLILDDGFQHRRLGRDLDIVVIDAREPFGNRWLLPAGPLREPLFVLSRAGAVVLSRSDQAGAGLEEIIREIRRRTAAPVFLARHRARDWIGIPENGTLPLESLAGRSCFAFSGIGHPDAFRETLRETGVDIAAFLRYPDHHRYRERDLKRVLREAEKHGASAILTTEKDGVRIPRFWCPHIPVYALRIDFELMDKEDDLIRMIEKKERFREEIHAEKTDYGGG